MENPAKNYPTFIGERIRLARNSREISQEELAANIGLSRPAISQIESGKRGVDSTEVLAISHFLQKPISYFLEESIEEEKRFSVLFRADEISERDRSVVEDFQELCKSYSQLESILGLQSTRDVPTWKCTASTRSDSVAEGEKVANDVRRILSLGTGPISDISALLENKGIRIWNKRLTSSKAWGFSVSSKELGWCIFVNSACTQARQSFTIAHELGHLVMDHDHKASVYSEASSIELRKITKSPIETRANSFAAAFLMPEAGLEEILSRYRISSTKDISMPVVDFLRQFYGVSYEAMLWRLLSLRMITPQQREALHDIRPKQVAPPDSSRVEDSLPVRYRTLALEAYRQARISIGKLATYLRVDKYEARKTIKDLALIQN